MAVSWTKPRAIHVAVYEHVSCGVGVRKESSSIREAIAHTLMPAAGMERAGCKRISEIVITHWHHDHLGGVPSVLRMSKVAPPPVRKFMPDVDEELFGGEARSILMTLYLAINLFRYRMARFYRQRAQDCVFFTPGHALDHISLVLENEGSMFTADNVLNWNFGF